MSISDIKSFNKALSSVKQTGEKIKPVLHEMAMWAAGQILNHRNTTPLEQMFNEIPGTVNLKGLAQWAVEFLPVAVTKGEVKVFSEKKAAWIEAVADIPLTLEQCNATYFWEFHTGSDVSAKPTNFKVELEKIIAKAMIDPSAEGADVLTAIYATLPVETKAEIDKRVTTGKKRLNTIANKQTA